MATFPLRRSSAALTSQPQPVVLGRLLALVALVATLIGLASAFPARSDRRVSTFRCSLASTDAIGRVSGAQLRLAPSSGTLCRYLPLDASSPLRSISVVALSESASRALPPGVATGRSHDGVPFIAYVDDERGTIAAGQTARRVAALIDGDRGRATRGERAGSPRVR